MNGFCLALAIGLLASPDSQATQNGFQPYAARVTGNNVYVRSGPSTVYYHVTMLQQDEVVQVVAHKYGFAQIKPPKDTHSLVPKDYVDDLGNGKGVINGNTWARADGGTDDAYAKHAELKEGDEIRILSEIEAYYRIEAPDHAALYISIDFIERSGPAAAGTAKARSSRPAAPRASANTAQAPANKTRTEKPPVAQKRQTRKPTPPARKTSDDAARSAQADPEKTAAATAKTPQDVEEAAELPADAKVTDLAEIKRLESRITEIQEQDSMDRDYAEVITGFQELGQTHGDRRVQQYSQFRANQMVKVMDRAMALQRLRQLDQDVKLSRLEYSDQRRQIQPTPPPVNRDYAVIGKMLKSFAYTNPVGPRRYRIVDVDVAGQRTIAYVEIERESNIDPQNFLGRHVGVRARSKRLIEGAVDPVQVFTVAEIVVLEQPPALELSINQQ